MKALEIKNISKRFGGFEVLKNVSFSVEPGERRAVIGPNGAGKTTLFNIISGVIRPDVGELAFYGRGINSMEAYQRARLGMARTFQKNNLFTNLSIEENIKLALRHKKSDGEVMRYLEEAGLDKKRNFHVKELSHGEQRQVELLFALAQSPKVILLDEPTAGLSPVETEQITRMIAGLPREITVLMIEHDMEVVFSLADRVTVLHMGEVLCDGDKPEVRNNTNVKRVYLGAKDGEDEG